MRICHVFYDLSIESYEHQKNRKKRCLVDFYRFSQNFDFLCFYKSHNFFNKNRRKRDNSSLTQNFALFEMVLLKIALGNFSETCKLSCLRI